MMTVKHFLQRSNDKLRHLFYAAATAALFTSYLFAAIVAAPVLLMTGVFILAIHTGWSELSKLLALSRIRAVWSKLLKRLLRSKPLIPDFIINLKIQ